MPQGNPVNPYGNTNPTRGNYPPEISQQQMHGQQWNAAPNFNSQQMPGQAGQIPPLQASQPAKKKSGKKGGGSVIGWIFLGLFLMIVLAFLGGYLGYRSAISARQAAYTERSAVEAARQYQLALIDVEDGKFANAKTRLDYIQKIDPNYPGLYDLMVQVNLGLYPTASPTPMITSTPAPSPTPDTRGEEEMFRGIQQAMYSQNWQSAIDQINALRNKNISYRGLEVDGMYYIALRNYGMQQINLGYLENGVYNITLAESFGPIDTNANSLRDAARSYLSGAGFWEINWSRAMELYGQAAMNYPNIMDRATNMTASQRYAQASFEVANEYVAREDYCGAIQYYGQGFQYIANESVQMTATAVYLICYPPQPTAAPQTESDSSGYTEPEDSEYYEDEEIYFGEEPTPDF